MKEKTKILGWHIFGIILVVTLWAALSHGQPVVKEYQEKQAKEELYPVSVTGADECKQRYEYDVSGFDDSNLSLIFFAGHQIIHVYADQKEIYSVELGEGAFASTTGPGWNYVHLPLGTGQLVICLEAVYSNIPMKSFKAYIGDAQTEIMERLRGSVGTACIDFIISAIGMALILFWVLERKNANNRMTLLYFGGFAFFLGLWCLNETEFVSILLRNHCGGSFFAFVMLMLIPIPYIKYTETLFSDSKSRFVSIFIAACILNICICIPLHLTGIAALKQTVVVTHALLVTAAAYQIVMMIANYIKKGINRIMVVNLIGLGGIIISAIIDLRVYYTSMQKNPVIVYLGILVSIIILGTAALLDAKRNIDELKSVRMYKEFALKDMQTGLYNRNAYDQGVNSVRNDSRTAIIVFDINNLKQCNDTYGHEAGDQLIIRSTGLMKRVFSRYGKIYRIGGDEFCAILKNTNVKNVQARIKEFKDLQMVNRGDVPLSIACGYALFDPETDGTIEDTRKRADRSLYEDKEKMKKTIGGQTETESKK